MSVGRICSRSVDLVDTSETIHAAAARMRDRDVGHLIAIDERRSPVGVVTDRDLVTRALAEGHDPESPVWTAMTAAPCTIAEEAPIESALSLMAFAGVRRLPVVDRGERLVGVIALDDVMGLLSEELGMIGKLLSSQVPCQADGGAKPPRPVPVAFDVLQRLAR
jgi:signal-transduction protein with cAMP-binding, CBS, and nucleotidyltransferase domain